MSEHNSKDDEIDKLQFVRIFTPMHIPQYLVEQVRDRDFTVEQFYEFQKISCIRKGENGSVLNPLNFLYVVVTDKNIAKGFLWAQADPLTNDFCINNFSMDKEYWGGGKAVKLLINKVKEILKECKMNKVYWITNFPKHSERYGFKRSKGVLMEYKEEDDGRIEDKTSGTGRLSESTAG